MTTAVQQSTVRVDRVALPGVLVLGMHRSGTSVVAGILDRLGLDAGPAQTLVEADQFNQDGYWEQRPLVALHDRVLRDQQGFASAPPRREPRDPPPGWLHQVRAEILAVLAAYDRPWFVKDPRQCLLLPVWRAAIGNDDLAVVVRRDPVAVARSLIHRNGYRPDVALALWERYTRDLLLGLAGRPCFFVDYDRLVTSPHDVVRPLADRVAGHLDDGGHRTPARVQSAVDLVRPREPRGGTPAGAAPALTAPQRVLADIHGSLTGYVERFSPPRLPRPEPSSERLLETRRQMLLWADRAIKGRSALRVRLDRPLRAWVREA